MPPICLRPIAQKAQIAARKNGGARTPTTLRMVQRRIQDQELFLMAEIRSGCLSGVPERNRRQLPGKVASDDFKEERLELVLLALIDYVDAHMNLIARIGAFVHFHDAALENVVVAETE